MKREKDYWKEFAKTFSEIHKQFPELRIGQVYSLAFSEYRDTFHTSDREMCYALNKHKTELELNVQDVAPEEYIDKIIEDANNHLFEGIGEDEEDEF